jgi:ABC-2 type transport system ATP-binding protein
MHHRIAEVLDLLEITDLKDTMFWHLSSGQKTRAILAKSLLNKPKMLLMDEPTASLDPEIVTKIIALIKYLQEHEKITILYTSHNMEEVARLCNRVAFLAKGNIVMEGSPQQLIQQVGTTRLLVGFKAPSAPVIKYLKKQKYVHELI